MMFYFLVHLLVGDTELQLFLVYASVHALPFLSVNFVCSVSSGWVSVNVSLCYHVVRAVRTWCSCGRSDLTSRVGDESYN